MKQNKCVPKRVAALFILAVLMFLTACGGGLTKLEAPLGPDPQSVFIIERDYKAAWNALLRAIDDIPDAEIWAQTIEDGKITLRDAVVMVNNNCECGSLGKTPLSGTATRMTTIAVGKEGPQLTRVRVKCVYTMQFSWQNVYGRNVHEQIIECISSGRFETELHTRTIKFLAR